MTEEQIERAVERKIDILDRRYLSGQLTEVEYKIAIKEIDVWADKEYLHRRR